MFLSGPSLIQDPEFDTLPGDIQKQLKALEAKKMHELSDSFFRPISRVWSSTGRAAMRMERMLRDKQREATIQQFGKYWESAASHTLAMYDHDYHHLHELEELMHLESASFSAAAKNALGADFSGTTDRFGSAKEGYELALAQQRALLFGEETVHKNMLEDLKKDSREHLWRYTLAHWQKFQGNAQDIDRHKMAMKEFTVIMRGAVSKDDIIDSAFGIKPSEDPNSENDYQKLINHTFNPSELPDSNVGTLKDVQKAMARLLALHGFVKKATSDPSTAASAAGVLLQFEPDNEVLKELASLKGLKDDEVRARLNNESLRQLVMKYKGSNMGKQLSYIEDRPQEVLMGRYK